MAAGWAAFLVALQLCLSIPPPALAADPPASTLKQVEQLAVSEVDKLAARARPLLDRYGYPAVFAAVLVEGVGIPGPGETLVIAGAMDAARGSLSIVVVLILAVAAAVLGNSAGYLIGRLGGRPLLRKLPIREERLARVEALFARFGAAFIVVARFVDGPRQLNGIMAGMLEMAWWRFSLWNLCGALLWVGVWGLGVYAIDRDFGRLLTLVRQIEPLAIVLSVAAILAAAVYVWRRRHATRDTG